MFIVDAKQGNVMNVSNSASPTATVAKQSGINRSETISAGA